MEKASQSNIRFCLSLTEPVGFIISDAILRRVQNFFLRFFQLSTTSRRVHNEECTKYVMDETGGDMELMKNDVEMVMESIGMSLEHEDDKVIAFLNSDEFSSMFNENGPSWEEVKAVFDENCDGFIDAEVLQRVLCNLGFEEALELDACHSMIAAHVLSRWQDRVI